jgi:hypothetical protein
MTNRLTEDITKGCNDQIRAGPIGEFLDELMLNCYLIISEELHKNPVYRPVVPRGGRHGGGNNNAELEHIGEVSAKIAYAAWLTSSKGKNSNAVSKAALTEALNLGVNRNDAKIYADIAAKTVSS